MNTPASLARATRAARCLRFVPALLAAALALPAAAGVAEMPGTDGVQTLIGVNDRGDVLWSPTSGGLRLSSKDAVGVYTHTAIDATVAGKGWAYSALAANGDAVWLGREPNNVHNIYFYDAATRSARALTTGTATRAYWPAIGGNGHAAWQQWVPLCNGCADGGYHIDYFDKTANQVVRLTAVARADVYVVMNLRGDAYWFERASDNLLDVRRYDALTRLVSVVARRPAGTVGRSLAVNDFGDVVWTELMAGTSRTDVFMWDQRSAAVRRITDTPAEDIGVRINAVGDLLWRAGPEMWTYNRRTEQARLVSNRATYNGDYAFNELGEIAWTKAPSDYIREMHYYKRANGADERVRPAQPYPMETQPALNGAGELFFVSAWGTDWLQRRIVRATREFNGN